METKERGLVIRAAGLLMIVQVLSRVLGYARDVVMVNIFGADFATDAWNAAFLIPDTLYQVLIGGAIGSALIPVFSSYINNDRAEEGWKANSRIVTNGNCVMMIAYSECDAVVDAFNGLF